MMKVKICGLVSETDATYVNENRADFAGFILFYPKSKRNLTLERAVEIKQVLDQHIKAVAVVVSPTYEQVEAIARAGFDYIQIHGQMPENMDQIDIPVLKAFNVDDLDSYDSYCNNKQIAGFVFDAASPGSGKPFDWEMLSGLQRTDKLWILAGGLTPDNVKEAIDRVRPDGVDVSSAVELGEGPAKDPAIIKRFIEAARPVTIRIATPEDAADIRSIYSYYVEKTAITFEYDIPTLEEFTNRIRSTLKKYPYLVAISKGKIVGYSYVGVFKARAAYDWAVETTIYVDPTQKRMGIGAMLYEAMEELAIKQGILNLYACIASPRKEDAYLTFDSIRFHEKMGYELVGTFHECGYKFDTWYDMVWMEKYIGEHHGGQKDVTWFADMI